MWYAHAVKKPGCSVNSLSMVPGIPAFRGSRLHLLITHKQSHYLGTLLFDDRAFCLQIYQILTNNCGKSIYQIGAIDLSYTL
jgi:hypothetical protein